MNKLLMVLSLMFVAVIASTKTVEAISVDFDYGNISPRFQYLHDENGTLIPFEFRLFENFDSADDVENVTIQLRQVTYDGTFLKDLQYFDVEYEIYNSNITYVAYTTTAIYDTNYQEIVDISSFTYNSISSVYVNGTLLSTSNWELNESGNFILIDATYSTTGDNIEVTYLHENSDSYIGDIVYDWSDLEFGDDNIVFYQVVYNFNTVLFTGAVMLQPEDVLPYDTYGVEFGEYLVEGDGLPDFSDQTDFTTVLDDTSYWILHYRIPASLIAGGYYRTIQITDIRSNTIEDQFTTNDILTIQGGSDTNFLNSFIVIPIGEEIGAGLVITDDSYNSRLETVMYDYQEGSYFIAMVDPYTSNSLEANASVVWNVVESELPFELSIFKEDIGLDDLQRLFFYKNSETISQAYTTVLAQDSVSLISYVDGINELDTTYASSYYLDESLVEGDYVNVSWDLEPNFVPYSLAASDFTITLDESYTVLGETDIEGSIRNLMIYNSMDDETGGWIFALFILLIANVILLITVRATMIYAFTNAILVLLLSYLGLVPMWVVIGLFILIIIGFKASLSGGINYE